MRVAAGLAIAKLKHPSMTQDGSREDWQKIYRTLIFTECLLSQMLGQPAHSLDIHVRVCFKVLRPKDQLLIAAECHRCPY
jgi:hypothetical protein